MGFCGSLVAIVTPFNSKGRLDTKALERLIEWQVGEGTDGIVCCGATGESTCLTPADRRKIIEICVNTSAKRIPIIAGTGTPDTKETVRFTEKAQQLGASGCLVVTPFYNRPTQRGCVLHYREVAKVGIPIIAYHNPPRTQVRLTIETLTEIGTIPGLVGVKEASGDIEFIRKLHEKSNLPILSGDDYLTHDVLSVGGVGTISTIGNIIPRVWKEMIRLSLRGRFAESKVISDRFLPLCKALFLESNPQCVKYVLHLMGKCGSNLRLPLVMPLVENQRELKKVLLNLSLPFRSLREEKRVL